MWRNGDDLLGSVWDLLKIMDLMGLILTGNTRDTFHTVAPKEIEITSTDCY